MKDGYVVEDGDNGAVRYSVKELLHRLDSKLDQLREVVDGRISSVETRVAELEKYQMRRAHLEPDMAAVQAKLDALEEQRTFVQGYVKAAWLIIGLLFTIAGLLIPIALNVV